MAAVSRSSLAVVRAHRPGVAVADPRRQRVVASVVAATFVGLIVACGGQRSATANGTIRIAADGADGLYVVTGDGSGLRRITRGTYDHAEAWSPDGSMIVFSRGAASETTISVMVVHPNGSGLHRIAEGVTGVLQPVWGPDGSVLAYSSLGDPSGDVLTLVRTDGSTRDLGTFPDPRLSRDGTKIASLGCGGLCIFDIAGRTNRHVAAPDIASQLYSDSGVHFSGFGWSPDGRRIAYEAKRAVKIVDIASGEQSEIPLARRGPLGELQWSPDGAWIAFASGNGLDVLRVDRRRPTHIGCAACSGPFAWSPSGRDIAYIRSSPIDKGILYLFSLKTGARRRISDPRFAVENGLVQPPQWTRDGKGIVFARERVPNGDGEGPADIWIAARGKGAHPITKRSPRAGLFWPLVTGVGPD
jgi:Tol biopolymer transport system component